MAGYGGNVLQLTLGDKGAYLYGVFGSPVAHEDDAARAAVGGARAARPRPDDRRARHPDRDRPRPAPERHVRPRDAPDVRLPRRRGEPRRAADVERRRSARSTSRTTSAGTPATPSSGSALPELTVKGKSATIIAHALTGSLERASRRKTRYQLDLVGRRDELARLDEALEADDRRRRPDRRDLGGRRHGQVAADRGVRPDRPPPRPLRRVRRVPVVRHEHELLRLARDLAPALPGSRTTTPTRPRRTGSGRSLAAIDPELVERAPLVSAVLGVEIAGHAAHRGDGREAPEGLARGPPRGRPPGAGRREEPVILVLEDCHWIDPLSRDLLEVLGRVDRRPAGPDRPRLPTVDRARRRDRRRDGSRTSARSSSTSCAATTPSA